MIYIYILCNSWYPKKGNYLVRTCICSLENYNFPGKLMICFENMIASFDKVVCSYKTNCLLREYCCFVSKYDSPAEVYHLLRTYDFRMKIRAFQRKLFFSKVGFARSKI